MYQLNANTAKHYCGRHCGTHPLIHPQLDPSLWAVNVRCLDGVDLANIPRHTFDSEHWKRRRQRRLPATSSIMSS